MILALLLLFISNLSFAKDVYIEWKPLKNAVIYELEFERNGEVFDTKKVGNSRWAGILPAGFYAYRIRAIDKFQRPGTWSSAKALVVMPSAPKPLSPSSSDKVTLYNSSASFVLSWEAVEGANKYKVEVKRSGSTVFSETVSDTRLEVRLPGGASAGDYQWQVQALIEAPSKAPAAYSGRSWASEPQVIDGFKIERKQLGKAVPIFPDGPILPPEKGDLRFRWREVDGAEAYEFRLYDKKVGGQVLISQKVSESSVTINLPEHHIANQGEFAWEVWALANHDLQKVAGAVGPKSSADFKLDPNAIFHQGEGFVMLSGLVTPFAYHVISRTTGADNKSTSVAGGVELDGEYWFEKKWGVEANIENTSLTALTKDTNLFNAAAMLKYRLGFGDDRKFAWFLIPAFGLELRHYPELRPNPAQPEDFQFFKPQTVGPTAGLELRHQFSEQFALGAKFSYYVPTFLDGVDGAIGGRASYRNMEIGLQGQYWGSPRWGMGFGGFVDQRSLGYVDPNNGNPALQEIYLDGISFFVSIIYSFGR